MWERWEKCMWNSSVWETGCSITASALLSPSALGPDPSLSPSLPPSLLCQRSPSDTNPRGKPEEVSELSLTNSHHFGAVCAAVIWKPVWGCVVVWRGRAIRMCRGLWGDALLLSLQFLLHFNSTALASNLSLSCFALLFLADSLLEQVGWAALWNRRLRGCLWCYF